MERGRIQGLPKFFGYPLLSEEWVKLRTSNFVEPFIGSIGTKAHENVGNSSRWRSKGVPKIFRAFRGHLYDSIAFLSEILPLICFPACHFFPTPPLVSPPPFGYKERKCWANCPCN